MATLNREVVNKLYTFLSYWTGEGKDGANFLEMVRPHFPTNWDRPVRDEFFVRSLARFQEFKAGNGA